MDPGNFCTQEKTSSTHRYPIPTLPLEKNLYCVTFFKNNTKDSL